MYASIQKLHIFLLVLIVGAVTAVNFPLEADGIIKISCTDSQPNAVCKRNGNVGKLATLPNDDILIEYGQGIMCQCPSNGYADTVSCDGTCTCQKCATNENDCSDPCAAAGWTLGLVSVFAALGSFFLL